MTANHTVEIQCRDMVHADRGLSVRIFLEGEPRVFCSPSMRDGTTHPSRSVLSVFLEKQHPTSPIRNRCGTNLALGRKWSHFGSVPVPDSVQRAGTGTGNALKERDRMYIKTVLTLSHRTDVPAPPPQRRQSLSGGRCHIVNQGIRSTAKALGIAPDTLRY